MYKFVGHVLPGSIFLMFSIWWAVDVFKHYFRITSRCQTIKATNPKRDFNVHNVHNMFRIGVINVSLNAVSETNRDFSFQILMCTIGIECLFMAGFGDAGDDFYAMIIQHFNMYMFFMKCGVSQLMASKSSWLPPNTHYFTLAMAYFGIDLLFYSHLHNKTPLDVQLHIILIVVITLATLSCLIELAFKSSPLAALLLPFFTFLMGTWFLQITFILYSPMPGHVQWADHDHNDLMLVTAIFCCHIFGAFAFFALLGCVLANIELYKSKTISEHLCSPLLGQQEI